MVYYESPVALSQYLWLHYGESTILAQGVCRFAGALHFPKRCADLLLGDAPGDGSARALDVGCAVGRSTFELARRCGVAVGIDRSATFIDVANRLKRGEAVTYSLPQEGDLTMEFTARAPEGVDLARVRFAVGDAMALGEELGVFQFVLAANLLCRLPDPRVFLNRLPDLVAPGGRVLFTTPASWKVDYTPREKWLGGFHGIAGPVTTFDGLQRAIGDAFELLHREDLPLVIPEHARKYELILAEATLWRRRA